MLARPELKAKLIPAILLASVACVVESPMVSGAPTFTKNVAPILFKKCVNCHGPGGVEFAVPLNSYDTVRPWAKAIKEKVLLGEMPPWPAAEGSLKFRNDARLSRGDVETIVNWVDAGAPQGMDADLPLPANFREGWQHPSGRKPDLVISLPEDFQAPANGEIPYLRYLVKMPLSEDKWVSAVQTRPGNPALVHHMAITEVALEAGVSPEDLTPFTILARQLGLPSAPTGARPVVTDLSNPAAFDMLGVYTPGTTIETFADDGAKLLKGGNNLYLSFNIHYQATGKPERDRSMIGLWFRPGPPKHQVFRVPGAVGTILAGGKELMTDTPGEKAEGTHVAIPPIPPNAENYELTGMQAFREPVTFYQFQPHAHLRAKDFQYTVVYPDGHEQVLLIVPRYDFRWQLAYDLESPLTLPAGSKLVVTAHYDNSRGNRFNPAPEREVFFRDQNQSWDEMFTPFVQYTLDSQDSRKPADRQAHVLPIVQVSGCLNRSASRGWMVTKATAPAVSPTQSTSSIELRTAESRPLGDRVYRLLGVSAFRPHSFNGRKVVLKGVLIENTGPSRINVTSLMAGAEKCAQ